MIYTLGLTELPFEPDKKQIIFTEGKHDDKVTDLIRWNWGEIRRSFESRNYQFCYIPYMQEDLLRGERLHYNAPFAKTTREAELLADPNFILDYVLHPEDRENIPPSLLFVNPTFHDDAFPEAKNLFRAISLSASSFEGDEGLSRVLDSIIHDIRYKEDDSERLVDCLREDREGIYDLVKGSFDFDLMDEIPDFYLDFEARNLFREIRERIEKLQQKGIDSYIIEEVFKNHKHRLSRLRICKDFRIYLPDYFGMEIRMTPLPKAVFILFLRHPEGIKFSYLPDFRDELMEIYKQIKGPNFNPTTAKTAIDTLTNPFNNSINEKRSRIREAFISHFDDHLARNYYIVGKAGEPMKITLPRNLVQWDK